MARFAGQGRAHHRRGPWPGARRGAGAGRGKARASRRSTWPGRWPTRAMRWARATTWPASPRRAAQLGPSASPSRPTCGTTRPSPPRWTTPSRAFGRIDILFNNAGICAYGLAHELTEDAWDAMLDINLKGSWLVARRVIPVMIAQRSGVILNNSSVAGLRGHGPAQPLRRLEVGAHRPHQVVGHRARAARHPGQLAPSHRRQHADERWAGRARGPHTGRDRRALGGQPAPGALGRARGRGGRGAATSPRTTPATSRARSS